MTTGSQPDLPAALIAVLNADPDSLTLATTSGEIIFANVSANARLRALQPGRRLDEVIDDATGRLPAFLHLARYSPSPVPGSFRLLAEHEEAGNLSVRASRVPFGTATDDGVLLLRWQESREQGLFTQLNAKISELEGQVREWRSADAERARLLARIGQLNASLSQTLTDLQRANASRDAFLGLVSHEVKNPLTSVAGIARHLERRFDHLPAEVTRELLPILARDADRLEEIIKNMLVLSRAEQELAPFEPISLPSLARRAISAYRRRHPSREVSLDIVGEPPPVMGRPDWMEHMVMNLLSNADRYSTAQEIVAVQVLTNDSSEVLVLDRGPGISPDVAGTIFDPFERGSSVAYSTPGVGLGLAVCKRLAGLMNGEIEVRARQDGPGTVGVLRFAPAH